MNVHFTAHAWAEYIGWDEKTRKKINRLIAEMQRTPFEGLGQPEPLKHQLQGYWSRRITQEHRLVYKVESGALVIVQARHHY